MGLFDINPKKVTVQDLQDESQAAVNIFQTTINKLQSINDSIFEEEKIRAAEIERLTEEEKLLEAQRASNSSLINKINDFLN